MLPPAKSSAVAPFERDHALEVTVAFRRHDADAIDDELRIVLEQLQPVFLERREHDLVELGARSSSGFAYVAFMPATIFASVSMCRRRTAKS